MLTAEEIKKACDDLATRQQQIAAQIQQLTGQLNQVVGAQIAYRDVLAKMEQPSEQKLEAADRKAPLELGF